MASESYKDGLGDALDDLQLGPSATKIGFWKLQNIHLDQNLIFLMIYQSKFSHSKFTMLPCMHNTNPHS